MARMVLFQILLIVGLASMAATLEWEARAWAVQKKEKKDKKDMGVNEEDAKIAKILEKAVKKPETERDKVIKELSKLMPDEPLGMDYGSWFDRVATGSSEWERGSIKKGGLRDIFDRMASRLNPESTRFTRAEFINYGRTYWLEDSSPLWKEPKEVNPLAEAEKIFKKLDRDHDGYLNPNEMPDALYASLRRWDKNRDGLINLDEYAAYFPARLDVVQREVVQQMERPTDRPPITLQIAENELDERPRVIRAGKLPAGLPAWFAQIDEDGDGQVALFEWRRAGWALDEFKKLDQNDDGFLVAEELLRLLAISDRTGARPFAYLLEKQAPGSRGGAKLSKSAPK